MPAYFTLLLLERFRAANSPLFLRKLPEFAAHIMHVQIFDETLTSSTFDMFLATNDSKQHR